MRYTAQDSAHRSWANDGTPRIAAVYNATAGCKAKLVGLRVGGDSANGNDRPVLIHVYRDAERAVTGGATITPTAHEPEHTVAARGVFTFDNDGTAVALTGDAKVLLKTYSIPPQGEGEVWSMPGDDIVEAEAGGCIVVGVAVLASSANPANLVFALDIED
jgi:hypothetical protein